MHSCWMLAVIMDEELALKFHHLVIYDDWIEFNSQGLLVKVEANTVDTV